MYTVMVKTRISFVHKCEGFHGSEGVLHGHTWSVRAFFGADELDDLGKIANIRDLERSLNRVLSALTNSFLNEIEPFSDGLSPTHERVAQYVYEGVNEILSRGAPQGLRCLKVILDDGETEVGYGLTSR